MTTTSVSGRKARAVTDSYGAESYGKLLRVAVIFFVVALAPMYFVLSSIHSLKEHDVALQFFLAVIFDFAITLMTFLAIIIVKAFAETFFHSQERALYFRVFTLVIVAQVAFDVPTYQLLGAYNFMPKDDLLGRMILTISIGGAAVFLGFIAIMVIMSIASVFKPQK